MYVRHETNVKIAFLLLYKALINVGLLIEPQNWPGSCWKILRPKLASISETEYSRLLGWNSVGATTSYKTVCWLVWSGGAGRSTLCTPIEYLVLYSTSIEYKNTGTKEDSSTLHDHPPYRDKRIDYRKFNTREVNRSSTVASDRSGNERADNVAKRVGFLKRGLRPNESSDVIADVWIAWGFQANFMYKPVL